MKNTFKMFCFFILVLAVAFSSITCDGEPGGSGGSPGPDLDVPYKTMSNFGEWRKLDIRNSLNQEVYYGYEKAATNGTVTFSTQRATDFAHVPIANGDYVMSLFVFGKNVTYADYASLPAQGLDGDDAVAQYVYIHSGESLVELGITSEALFMANFSSLLTNIPTQGSSSYSITLPMLEKFRRMW